MTTTNNAARDELALELFIADNSNQPREQSLVDWEWFEGTGKSRGRIQHYKDMAAGMLAAGYRKPRTIETVEELDALAEGSVVIDVFGAARVLINTPMYLDWRRRTPADVGGENPRCRYLPVTVLWEPEP